MIGDKLYLGLSLIQNFVRLLPEVEVGFCVLHFNDPKEGKVNNFTCWCFYIAEENIIPAGERLRRSTNDRR